MASNGKFQGREVVIVEAVRTPIGRGHEEKGYYKDVHASSLLSKTFKELVDRAGIEASEVEDVVAGCVQQFGEQGLEHRSQRLARGRASRLRHRRRRSTDSAVPRNRRSTSEPP